MESFSITACLITIPQRHGHICEIYCSVNLNLD